MYPISMFNFSNIKLAYSPSLRQNLMVQCFCETKYKNHVVYARRRNSHWALGEYWYTYHWSSNTAALKDRLHCYNIITFLPNLIYRKLFSGLELLWFQNYSTIVFIRFKSEYLSVWLCIRVLKIFSWQIIYLFESKKKK